MGETGRDVLGTDLRDRAAEVRVAADAPDLTRAIGRARGRERQALGEEREEDIAKVAAIGEGAAQIAEPFARDSFDLSHERRDLLRRAFRREHLRLEIRDHLVALAQLGRQLGDVVRERDRFREALLLGAHVRQLALQRLYVRFALRHLCGQLVADLAEDHLEHAFAEDVLLQMIDQRGFDIDHRLMHGDRAHRAAAIMVLGAAVAEHAALRTSVGGDARRTDRAAARAALRDAGQRIARGAMTALVRIARGELLVHGEPRRVIDDPPLGHIRHDDFARVGLHAHRAAALAHLLDAAMHVHAAIAWIEQDRPHRARRPRATAAAPGRRRRHTIVVQLVSDRLHASTCEVLAIDALDRRSVLLIDDGHGEAAARGIRLTLQLVSEARAARDPAVPHAISQCFARARADRLQLHLVAGALDERRRLIDSVREEHLLAGRVVVEQAPAIAHEITDHERHLDRVATETRLIAADDHVAALRICDQLAQSRAREEVIASAAIIDVVDASLIGVAHPVDHLDTAFELHVEAELLLAFVVLRASAVGANDHGLLNLQTRRNHPARRGSSQRSGSAITPIEISSRRRMMRASARAKARPSPTRTRSITGRLQLTGAPVATSGTRFMATGSAREEC